MLWARCPRSSSPTCPAAARRSPAGCPTGRAGQPAAAGSRHREPCRASRARFSPAAPSPPAAAARPARRRAAAPRRCTGRRGQARGRASVDSALVPPPPLARCAPLLRLRVGKLLLRLRYLALRGRSAGATQATERDAVRRYARRTAPRAPRAASALSPQASRPTSPGEVKKTRSQAVPPPALVQHSRLRRAENAHVASQRSLLFVELVFPRVPLSSGAAPPK